MPSPAAPGLPSHADEPSPSDPRQIELSPELRRTILLVGFVALVAAAAFVPSLRAGFLYDDIPLIVSNDYVQSFAHWRLWFTTHFWHVSTLTDDAFVLVYYRPLVTLSYAIDWWFGGGHPAAFHLTNLAMHVIASSLAFLAIRRWIGEDGPALLASLVFIVHPTKAEAVAWIAGRTELLLAIGLLLAAVGVAYRVRGRRWVGIGFEVLGTCIAYLSKESAIVLPVIAAVEAWIGIGRPALGRSSLAAVARTVLPHAVVAVAYVVVRWFFWLPIVGQAPSRLHPIDHALIALESFGRYLHLTVVPYPLSVQQGLIRAVEGRFVATPGYVVLAVTGLVLALSAVWVWRRSPLGMMGLAMFFACLAPTLNLVPTRMVTMISERFLYVPTLGLAVLLAWGLSHCAGKRRVQAVGVGAVVLCFFFASAARAHQYSDAKAFWTREAKVEPRSLETIRQLISISLKEGDRGEAIRLAQLGHAMADKWFAYTGRSAVFSLLGVELRAAATPDVDTASLEQISRYLGDLSGTETVPAVLALPDLQVASRRLNAPNARVLDGTKIQALVLRAHTASRIGDDAAAMSSARQALQKCARCVHVQTTAALVFARAGRFDDARQALSSSSSGRRLDVIREQVAAAEQEARRSEVASGPARLVALARTYAILLAWGRAYRVLQPHRAEFERSPDVALSYGELAYRAGAHQEAREILRLHLPDGEIVRRMRTWEKPTGSSQDLE